MRWTLKEPVDHFDWHPVIAWFPVKVGKTWVWLETVDRRRSADIFARWDYQLREKPPAKDIDIHPFY